jgi:diguanylate cyclase (GGDEF)-like protein/PAS domain S-box-containing protein
MLGSGVFMGRVARWRVFYSGLGRHRVSTVAGAGLCLIAGILSGHHLAGADISLEPLAAAFSFVAGLVLVWRTAGADTSAGAQWDYRSIFENAVEGIFLVDERGRVVAANPALARILGYPSSEDMLAGISNVSHQVYVDPGARKAFQSRLESEGAVSEFETRWRRKDGVEIWVSVSGRRLERATPRIASYVGMAEDITRRKRDEEDLRRFRLALDNSADLILLIDRASMLYVDANRTACRLLGYSKEELLAMGPHDLLPAQREDLARAYDELIAGLAPAGGMNSYYRCKDGSRLPFESTRHVLRSGDRWLIAAISRDIRERIAAERSLRESEDGLRRAQLMARLAHVITAADGAFLSWSETLPGLAGLDESNLPRTTRDWLGLVHEEDRAMFRDASLRAAATRRRTEIEYRLRRRDGSWIDVSQTMEPLESHDEPSRLRWFNTLQDVTERTEAESRIKGLNRVYSVLSGINALIVRARSREELFRESCRLAVEAGRFQLAWVAVHEPGLGQLRLAAWHGSGEGYVDRMPMSIDPSAPDYGMGGRALAERRAIVVADMTVDPRVVLQDEARKRGFRSVVALPLFESGEVAGVLTLYGSEAGFFNEDEMKLLLELAGDISFALEHIRKSEQVEYLAYYDPLTGLANRTLFHERLEQAIMAAKRDGRRIAVLVHDLERFRTINDSFGRQAGDDLLRQVASRLQAAARDASWIGRLGADQFAVWVPDVTTEEELMRRTEERLGAVFGAPYRLNGEELRISARLGVAVYPTDGGDAETLIRNAEAALKKAKAGGERSLFYTETMTANVAEKLSLENKLRRALERGEFVLHYQPKVDMDLKTIRGAEALIRWNSPELGLVPPAKFVPLLEETGLILEAGSWALSRAASDHRAWFERGLAPPRVAVNVSAIQLRQRDFVATVERSILEGLAPAAIDLEITESLIMEDIKTTIAKLNEVRRLRVGVAIDDFGTGYSSLAYLAQLPVETLKIDRAFVVTMLEDPNNATLVQMIISLARSLRLNVVAEGVETEQQANFLRLLHCDQMQGYFFSKPMPASEFAAFLEARR